MANKSKSELILEASKIFIWPMFVTFAVLFFQEDVTDILKNRTWKFGIIEVGDRIKNLHSDFNEELLKQKDYLEKIERDASDPKKVKIHVQEALKFIENVQKGVKKDIEIIQEVLPEDIESKQKRNTTEKHAENSAKFWEIKGFNTLLDKDIDEAISSFRKSEKIEPYYHNVNEIRRFLIREKSELNDKKWSYIYNTILKKYSWGMPLDIQEKFKASLKEK